MAERKKYEDGWTETEKVPGEHDTPVIVGTDPIERGMYNVGVTYNQIKETVGDVGGGTEVVANSDEVATEQLENIKVGEDVYGIPRDFDVFSLKGKGSSGTLTDEEYDIIKTDHCVIKTADDFILFKWYETDGMIYYRNDNANTEFGGIKLDTYIFNIYKDTKNWSYTAQSRYARANVGTGSSGMVTTLNFGAWNESYRVFPDKPSDASTKTYVLKLVNGTLTWVEE